MSKKVKVIYNDGRISEYISDEDIHTIIKTIKDYDKMISLFITRISQ